MATIQVRVDDATKLAVENILTSLGVDMTTAIRMYLKKIQYTRSIPFSLSQASYDENGFTPAERREILSAWKESKEEKDQEKFSSMGEAISSLTV